MRRLKIFKLIIDLNKKLDILKKISNRSLSYNIKAQQRKQKKKKKKALTDRSPERGKAEGSEANRFKKKRSIAFGSSSSSSAAAAASVKST